MAFFNDMAAALAAYPETEVTLEFVEVGIPGEALNVGETATFKVKITNNGPLDLTGVTLRVKGLNGAKVADIGVIAPFEPEFVTQAAVPLVRGAGGSALTLGPLKFKAPAQATGGSVKDLVKVTLEDWDASLDRILNVRSQPLPTVSKTFSDRVVGS